MGRSRLVHPRGLTRFSVRNIAVLGLSLFVLAACGGSDPDELLEAADLSDIYAGSSSAFFMDGDREARGTITGKVIYKGRRFPPKVTPLSAMKPDCRSVLTGDLMSEDFLVNDNGALKNALVWIQEGIAGTWPAPSEPIVLDQKGCRYIPHVAVIQVGQGFIIKNSDNFLHNVKTASANETMNTPMSRPSQLAVKRWRKTEIGIEFKCDVHSWMQGWVSVVSHPFWILTGDDGSFKLSVPPGTYKVGVWHESCQRRGEGTLTVKVKTGEINTLDITMELK